MNVNSVNGLISSDISKNQVQTNKNNDTKFENTLEKAYKDKDLEKLKKTCNDFESLLLGMMYKEMRKSIPNSELIPQESGREVFQSMLDEELVKESSKNGSLGLGDMLYKQLSKQMTNKYIPNNK